MRVGWFTPENLGVLPRRHRADDTPSPGPSAAPARRPGRRRGHRPAPRSLHRRRRVPLPASWTPPTRSAPWRCPPTCTPTGSTSPCPRPWPPPPSTGSCTSPTSVRPAATPSASPRRSGSTMEKSPRWHSTPEPPYQQMVNPMQTRRGGRQFISLPVGPVPFSGRSPVAAPARRARPVSWPQRDTGERAAFGHQPKNRVVCRRRAPWRPPVAQPA